MDQVLKEQPNERSIDEVSICLDMAGEHLMFLKSSLDGINNDSIKLVMTDMFLALNELIRSMRIITERTKHVR